MAADNLVFQGTMASTAMVLNWISRNIPVWATEGLKFGIFWAGSAHFKSSTSGSGHEGGLVLLPGFAIKWQQNQVTRQAHLPDLTCLQIIGCVTGPGHRYFRQWFGAEYVVIIVTYRSVCIRGRDGDDIVTVWHILSHHSVVSLVEEDGCILVSHDIDNYRGAVGGLARGRQTQVTGHYCRLQGEIHDK